MLKLDVKDKKLLYYLSTDSRLSYTQLSKKISLSKNTVKYRIQRLKDKGIITKFASIINLGSINLTTVALLLRFNEDIYENPSIIEYFKNHNKVNWVASLSGQWDIFAEFIVPNITSIEEILDNIILRFGNLLNTYQIFFSSFPLRVEHLTSDFYKDLQIKEVQKKQRTKNIYKIDEIDKKILQVLNEDSSLSLLKIAEKLELTTDIVRYRIKNLKDKGIILKFFSEINLKNLGYTEYLYTISLKNISQERLQNLHSRIKEEGNIRYAFYDAISQKIIFTCAYKDSEGIDKLSRNIRKEYSDIINHQQYLLIKDQILFNLFPKGLLAKTSDSIKKSKKSEQTPQP